MNFMDIGKGSDLEFGQSIYEPFGIAQVELLSFGALCCVSSVCGCVGFADAAAAGELPGLVVADSCKSAPTVNGLVVHMMRCGSTKACATGSKLPNSCNRRHDL
ncbi:MAG: hypothetical protein R2932_46240 [Caldilineaceae bacterium]